MTYDPFQIHSALGAYPGLTTPFQSPYMQLNPVAAFNQQPTAYPPMGGISPQHLQLAQILAARAAVPHLLAASPWTTGLNNPLLASAVLQNPLIAATLENPLMNPLFAQTQFGAQPYPFNPYMGQSVPQFGHNGSPYGQIPPQFGQIGSPYGQVPPQFGQNGSPYGQIPPQFGHNGSPYGQIQPQFGQNGSPYGQI
ncbi:MAG: hypothetical protein JWO48_990, partial [Bryobacterales bacterium]|nr:hypothetical protein [Bryobacterales bacterium]